MSYPQIYDAHVIGKQGRWWVIEIPELGPYAVTQALELEEVEATVLDYIAVTWDCVLHGQSSVNVIRKDLEEKS